MKQNPLIAKSGIEFVAIPKTRFFMGSTRSEIDGCIAFWSGRLVNAAFTPEIFQTWIEKEFPAHPVTLEPFYIAKYPITNDQYAAFCRATGAAQPESLTRGFPGDHPAWGVEFDEATAFTRWLALTLQRPFRLPTEAEWEFTARGPNRLTYPYGDDFCSERANTTESGIRTTTPVDRYERWVSPLGVCDLAGNVEEWVDGRYAPYPGGCFVSDDLVQHVGKNYRLLRGGSFARGGDLTRGARRHGRYPSPEYRYTGFRIAIDKKS